MPISPFQTLLQHPAIWRGDTLARVTLPSVATGHTLLDRELPGGGWPAGALTELLHDREGIGELGLVMPALARLTQAGRWVAWVAPPHRPHAPALAAAGLDLARLLVVGRTTPRDDLWAAEQALRAGCLGALLFWPDDPDSRALRRLQLAAEARETLAFLYRPLCAAEQASPAALRLRLLPREGGLSVHILKRRGGVATAPLELHWGEPASPVEGGPEQAVFSPVSPLHLRQMRRHGQGVVQRLPQAGQQRQRR